MSKKLNKKIQDDENAIMYVKLRRHRFTWNNYTKANVEHLSNLTAEDCDYIVFGFEICPTTGTPHLQGYVEWRSGTSGFALKNKLDPEMGKLSKIKVLECSVHRDANIAYCKKEPTKDESMPVPFIELIFKEKHQGKSSSKAFDDLYDAMLDADDYAELLASHTEFCIKYTAGVKAGLEAIKEKKKFEAIKERFEGKPLRKWQQELVNEMTFTKADDRKIIWYVDNKGNGDNDKGGNKGKTWISLYMAVMMGAAVFANGKSSDIAHAYNDEPIVIFNFSRTQEERLNYSVLECIKDGVLFSSKYNSRTKYFNPPHIIVMANWCPRANAMSQDRLDIRYFKEGDCDFPEVKDESKVVATNNRESQIELSATLPSVELCACGQCDYCVFGDF